MWKIVAPRQLRRMAALPPDERWLLLRAATVVACTRLALWAVPFRQVCAWARDRHGDTHRADDFPEFRLAWAVSVVARRIPGASCLTQALALQWMLARTGRRASLHIGVAKSAACGLRSHAWLECGGRIVLGIDAGVHQFVPILALSARKS